MCVFATDAPTPLLRYPQDPVCRMVESEASSGGGNGDTPPPPLSSGASDGDAQDSMESETDKVSGIGAASAGESEGGTPPLPFSAVSQGAGGGSDEAADGTPDVVAEVMDESKEVSAVPLPIAPTVEELKRDFPNAPKAPWSTTVAAKDFKPEDLIAGQMEVSYGGQVRCR